MGQQLVSINRLVLRGMLSGAGIYNFQIRLPDRLYLPWHDTSVQKSGNYSNNKLGLQKSQLLYARSSQSPSGMKCKI